MIPPKYPPIPPEEQHVLPDEKGKAKMEPRDEHGDSGAATSKSLTTLSSRKTLSPTALYGLYLARKGVTHAVATERMKLREASHNTEKEVALLKVRLSEQKDHLKFLNRKLAEKNENYDRTSAEYERAHELYVAACKDGTSNDFEQISARRAFKAMCETLDNSWFKNVDFAKRALSMWAFKVQRQTALVEKVTNELAEAEKQYAYVHADIDGELKHLQELAVFLTEL